ncbi:MAG: DNA mismatch repair endonuclease MutL [Saprospiraceae bacterium]|nr:DNA mismatch repair endonuclease MutL [Saprospiraceae bacterium]
MADIIQLLPESIANQIAAGEVVQRPASVVKELMENAIDAGATSVKLIVKDAGKALIQVIDNGCGMSETDARMCFERHATSKIREAKDLFAIRTMGFRGEAMASIAAVSQVEMRTRLHNQELGTRIAIEASKLVVQEPCQCTPGSNVSVKNLFYNVPARRNFLKSNPIEMRHILDEFQRIALSNEDVFFSLHNNGTEVFHLPPGNLRQRIVGIFGNNFNPKLVPVKEETDVMSIGGFIGKPEFARKTRGEQLFFVNDRFIKSGYLHHAVMTAYEELLPKETFPFYVIFLEMDPVRIDINVHPTKQEIKFDDERLVYNYLRVAVRHALGTHSIMPELDFEAETSFSATKNFGLPFTVAPQSDFEQEMSQPRSHVGTSITGGFGRPATNPRDESNLRNWQQLYTAIDEMNETPRQNMVPDETGSNEHITIGSNWAAPGELDDAGSSFSKNQKEPYQVQSSFIVSHIKSGFLLIDQQAAHERILYERYLDTLESRQVFTQKELFPKTFTLPTADAAIFGDIMSTINQLGFDIQEFGKDSFIIHGIPADLASGQNEVKIIETLLEQYKQNIELSLDLKENLARSMARSAATKRGTSLSVREMQELIDQLFACAMPFKSPSGRNCFLSFDLEELEEMFLER